MATEARRLHTIQDPDSLTQYARHHGNLLFQYVLTSTNSINLKMEFVKIDLDN